MVIRVGIIGLSTDPSAWATIAHYTPLTQKPLSDHYKLTAVCTSSKTSAIASAKAFGLPEDKAYDNAEAMARDKDVDLVTVSIKVPFHYQAAMPSLKAKKSTIVEWPLGANTAQAEELASVAKSQGVKNAVMLQARATPLVQKIKSIVDSGDLGKVRATTFVGSTSLLTDVPEKYYYINDPTSGASIVSISVAHTVDPLCYVLGEFSWLSANLTNNFPEVYFVKKDGTKTEQASRNFHDSIAIQGVLKTGPSVSYVLNSITKGTPDRLEWIIIGDKKSLKIEGESMYLSMGQQNLSISGEPAKDAPEGSKDTTWTPVEVDPVMHYGSVGEVYHALALNDLGPLVNFDEAVKRHHMVDAIFWSGEKGTRESY